MYAMIFENCNFFVISVKLKLLSLDEEYVFSMPSAYARSILTVPWAEMGDKVNMTCQRTNMSAAITFHTKVIIYLFKIYCLKHMFDDS